MCVCFLFPEANNQLIGFVDVCAPLSRIFDFLPMWTLIVVCNPANDDDGGVVGISGIAVIGVQCEQEEAEHP